MERGAWSVGHGERKLEKGSLEKGERRRMRFKDGIFPVAQSKNNMWKLNNLSPCVVASRQLPAASCQSLVASR